MNLTTKAERNKVDERAAQLMKLDRWTRMLNAHQVEDALMQEFGISRQRAVSATARAVRKFRDNIRRNDPAAWERIREGDWRA